MKLFCLIAQFFLYCSVAKCLLAESVRKSDPIDKSISSSKNSWTIIRFEDEDDDGIHGTADKDYPVLTDIPRTAFSCVNRMPGYYADLETRCQVFHMCVGAHKSSFLCHNGTIFNQKLFTCDWWYTTRCDESPSWFFLNANLYKKNVKSNATKSVDGDVMRLNKKSAQLVVPNKPKSNSGVQKAVKKNNVKKQQQSSKAQ